MQLQSLMYMSTYTKQLKFKIVSAVAKVQLTLLSALLDKKADGSYACVKTCGVD